MGDKRKATVYMTHKLLEEVKNMAEDYGVSTSKIFADVWKIAKNCNCQIPKGIVAYSKERGRKYD